MTLGRVLRERRVELGKSLEQISASTRIHVRILAALEEDRYADLPARTFTRGFITSYCKALRLNPDKTVEEHHEFLEQKFNERLDRDQGHQGYVFEGKEIEQNKRGWIIAASLAMTFVLVVLFFFKPQNHKRKEKHKEFTNEDIVMATPAEEPESEDVLNSDPQKTSAANANPVAAPSVIDHSATPAPSVAPSITPVSKVKAKATPTPAPSAAPAATPSGSPPEAKKDPLRKGDDLLPKEIKRKIAFEALDDSIVKYQVDQLPSITFTLRKGRFLVIKAKETLTFETDKPEALRYRTNTRAYQPLQKNHFSVGNGGTLVDP